MQRRTYLRTVGLAVPGLLLSGWAPARAATRPLHLVVRDMTRGGSADGIRAGVAFGVADITRSAELTQSALVADWASSPSDAVPDAGAHIVIAHEDPLVDPVTDGRPCIYTCQLREWRPEAWSVAAWSPTGVGAQEWHPTLAAHGAADLNRRFLRHSGREMDAAAWRGWMAVKVAFEAALRANSGEDDLLALRFDGCKGQPLRFREDGHLAQPTYLVQGSRPHVVAQTTWDDDEE